MQKNKSGFTLIELLVVIAIIGLLSTLSVLALNTARARARDSKRVADVKQMQTALEMYFNDNNTYPASSIVVSGGPLISPASSSTLIAIIPAPPKPVDGATCGSTWFKDYTYTMDDSGASYHIDYCLGSKTGSVTAGVHEATPGGIQNP